MNRVNRSEDGLGASRPDYVTLTAFVLVVLIGGSNAVAVRFSNLELPPFWGAATRFGAAALISWVIVLGRRIALPQGRALIGALLYGLLGFGASYAFLYWGLLRVQAGLTMVVLALVPLLTLFFALAHGLETFRWRGLIGVLISIAGIFLAVGEGLGTTVPVASLLAIAGGAACIAEATVVIKLFPKSHPIATNALALTIGTSLLFGLSLLVGEPWNLPSTSNTWTAFIYLVLIGSVILFYLYLFVLTRWTASATAYSILLMPVATVVIAAWLAGEAVTTAFVLGGVLILAGVWVGAISGSVHAAISDSSPTPEEVIP
jgi:drug/metabolite transporter (DMT)-like permease